MIASKKIIIPTVVFAFVLLFPSVKKLNYTYRDSSWTSSTFRKHTLQLKDYQFASGYVSATTNEWTRIRLGLFIKPITIDIHKFKSLQVRFETQHFFLNLVIAFSFAIIVLIVKKLFRRNTFDLFRIVPF